VGHRSIDLNADLGEGCPWDVELLRRVTSASICCGSHAGDRDTSLATLAEAKRRGVLVGAHPGFPDRDHFGRRVLAVGAGEVERLVLEQVGVLRVWAEQVGVAIRFLKPHGALYNQAQRDDSIAAGVISAAAALRLPVLGQPAGCIAAQAAAAGVPFIAEGFADRGYGPDGLLLPRQAPGAILHDRDQIQAQALALASADIATICIHGDNPESIQLADLVRGLLVAHRIALEPLIHVDV
jgi:UPF0271 protein